MRTTQITDEEIINYFVNNNSTSTEAQKFILFNESNKTSRYNWRQYYTERALSWIQKIEPTQPTQQLQSKSIQQQTTAKEAYIATDEDIIFFFLLVNSTETEARRFINFNETGTLRNWRTIAIHLLCNWLHIQHKELQANYYKQETDVQLKEQQQQQINYQPPTFQQQP